MLDALEEEARGENRIGTTSRGIGPAYQDKVARFGIRMGEFVDPTRFKQRLQEVLAYKNRLLEMFGSAPIAFEGLYEEYSKYADRLRPFVRDTEVLVQNAVARNERVLFEGAQGVLLDRWWGTYPFVTSSDCLPATAAASCGISPQLLGPVVGVLKAYVTRVGSGPFPTELDNELGHRIRERGREYGTTTGRPRRCGWLDLVAVRYSAMVCGATGIACTLFDVLSGFDEIKLCVRYRLPDGTETDRFIPDAHRLEGVTPIYETMPGWSDEIRDAADRDSLPATARKYLSRIEEVTGIPIEVVSLGPERTQTLVDGRRAGAQATA
jgi:adenylosuccinate synthase